MNEQSGQDDSDVPTDVVVQAMINGPSAMNSGYTVGAEGGIEAGTAAAERFEDESGNGDHQLGCGKCRKQPNRQYTEFWRHDDNGPADKEDD